MDISHSSQWKLLKSKLKQRQQRENDLILQARNSQMKAIHESCLESLFKIEEDIKELESVEGVRPKPQDFTYHQLQVNC